MPRSSRCSVFSAFRSRSSTATTIRSLAFYNRDNRNLFFPPFLQPCLAFFHMPLQPRGLRPAQEEFSTHFPPNCNHAALPKSPHLGDEVFLRLGVNGNPGFTLWFGNISEYLLGAMLSIQKASSWEHSTVPTSRFCRNISHTCSALQPKPPALL